MHSRALSALVATVAALALAAAPAFAGEDDDGDERFRRRVQNLPALARRRAGGFPSRRRGDRVRWHRTGRRQRAAARSRLGRAAVDGDRRRPRRSPPPLVITRLLALAVGLVTAAGGAVVEASARPLPAYERPGRPPVRRGRDHSADRNSRACRDSQDQARRPRMRLGLDPTGALEAPRDFSVAGWWTGGSRPGEVGPAVIAGHVDSKTGPAVFYELGRLHKGDAVYVRLRDGAACASPSRAARGTRRTASRPRVSTARRAARHCG